MIECMGEAVVFNGKVVGRIAGDMEVGFYLQFKAGRRYWFDDAKGCGVFESKEDITRAVIDPQNRGEIIVSAFTGTLVPPMATTFIKVPGAILNAQVGGNNQMQEQSMAH